MTVLLLLRLLYLGIVSGFFVAMYSRRRQIAQRSARANRHPPCAMFTFQLIKTASRGTELDHDDDRSACLR